jgi:hypothetical protein
MTSPPIPHDDDFVSEFATFEAFRDQAAETIGFVRPLKVAGFEIPNPSNLSPDQAQRYNELRFSLEDLDRWPDTKNDAGEVIVLGAPRQPHRQNRVLVEDYDTRLAKAIFDEDYPEFIAAGGHASDVKIAWSYMNSAANKRAKADPKSVGSAGAAAEVSDADRVGPAV